jgi:hypothetical protein
MGSGIKSVSIWIKPNNITTNQYITRGDAGTDSSILLGFQDNYFNIYLYPTGTATDTQIPATINEWQHIVFTFDGTNTQGYKNGVKIFDVVGICGMGAGFSTYWFGLHGTSYFNGALAKPKLFDRALTNLEVMDLYKKQKAGLR